MKFEQIIDCEKLFYINLIKWKVNLKEFFENGDNILFKKIESHHINKIENKNINEKYKEIISLIKNNILKVPIINNNKKIKNKKNVLFIKSYERWDVDKDTSKIIKILQSKYNVSYATLEVHRKHNFDLFRIIKTIIITYKIINCKVNKFCEKINIQSNIDKVLLYLWTYSAINDLYFIKNCLKHQNIEQVYLWQEMLGKENLIAQYYNFLNIDTIALQHALAILPEQTNEYYLKNLQYYATTVSKKILVWGDVSYEQYENITNSKIIVVGKPHVEKNDYFQKGITFIYDNDKEQNFKLIELERKISELGIKTSNWYKPQNNKINEYRKGPLYSIAIGFQSSLLVTLGINNVHVILLKNSPLEKYIDKINIINTYEELVERYKKYEDNFENKNMSNNWKKFIRYYDKEFENNLILNI
jgi:hypothetical protein